MTLYDDLGVPKNATAAEIKKAHRAGVKKHHPDAGGDTEKFGALARAYEVLGDPNRRQRYDDTGDASSANPAEVLEREAMNIVISAVQRAVLAAPNVDLTDIIAQAKGAISGSVQSLAIQRLSTLADQDKIDRVLKRLKRRSGDGPDVIADMLRSSRDGMNVRIASLDHIMEAHARATEIIGQYGYTVDAHVQPGAAGWPPTGMDELVKRAWGEGL